MSHAPRLIAAREDSSHGQALALDKSFGQTMMRGQTLVERPAWYWLER